jgi:hypothetical protein
MPPSSKACLWIGAIIILLGSGFLSEITYSIGIGAGRVPPSYGLMTLALCFVVWALGYAVGYERGQENSN